jgi:hypothetical protein
MPAPTERDAAGNQREAAALRTEGERLHGAGYRGMQQESADALRSRYNQPRPTAEELEADRAKAKECLEAFRKQAMDQIRNDNMNKYATSRAASNASAATSAGRGGCGRRLGQSRREAYPGRLARASCRRRRKRPGLRRRRR